MITDNGRSVSVWMDSTNSPDAGMAQETLDRDLSCDVAIVGGGMAGLSVAYCLSREGKKVVVLDDGPIAGGETCRTTAHLTFSQDDGNAEVESIHGLEGLKGALESHSAAVDFIEQTIRTENIECGFDRVNGYLFVSPQGQSQDFLEKELDACHRAGYKDVHFAARAPLAFETGRCLVFPRHGRFHPLEYLRGLTAAITRAGGLIFPHTHVDKIEGGANARLVTSEGRTVKAGAIVVATNSPVNDRVTMHTKQAAYRTYAISAPVPNDSITRGLYWDTEDPYHYVRTQRINGQDILIVGGEDHKTGQANDAAERWDNLEKWMRERFPEAGPADQRWSGQTVNPVDYLAFIGPNPGDEENVFIATGDSGMGMTHGTIAGFLITDLIMGRSNPWTALYDPARKAKSMTSLKEFAVENLNVAAQYRDLVTSGDVKSADDIPADSGAVLRRGLHKVAAYRDAKGQLYECSAICPHLGCVVRWNDGEKSWDCPCHGSRFDATGNVVNGPANSALKPLE